MCVTMCVLMCVCVCVSCVCPCRPALYLSMYTMYYFSNRQVTGSASYYHHVTAVMCPCPNGPWKQLPVTWYCYFILIYLSGLWPWLLNCQNLFLACMAVDLASAGRDVFGLGLDTTSQRIVPWQFASIQESLTPAGTLNWAASPWPWHLTLKPSKSLANGQLKPTVLRR